MQEKALCLHNLSRKMRGFFSKRTASARQPYLSVAISIMTVPCPVSRPVVWAGTKIMVMKDYIGFSHYMMLLYPI